MGIGDPSKPGLIQLPAKEGQSEFLRDSNGNLVKSGLNETQLKQLAKATNGIYIRSTAVDPGLNILEKKNRTIGWYTGNNRRLYSDKCWPGWCCHK